MKGTFSEMFTGLQKSLRRYPNCRIANCDCDEHSGEWKPGCFCMGHWTVLNSTFGGESGDWSLADAVASARVGEPVRAAREDIDDTTPDAR